MKTLRLVYDELRHHAPFTAIGAVTGIALILVFHFADIMAQVNQISETVFYVLHPLHVTFSAIVTTSLYRKYKSKAILSTIVVGYVFSVDMATLSDSLIPYLGEIALALPQPEAHIGFLEEWWLVNLAAFAGIGFSFIKPATKLPHSAHVLISTWASLFHIIMALGTTVSAVQFVIIFLFLFIAVWVPCCLSDIALPMIVVGKQLPHEH